MRWIGLISIVSLATACTTLPDVPQPGRGFDDDVDFPDFLPMREIMLEDIEAAERNAETEEELDARVAGLKARAAGLRNVETD
jgi:hypothetical protein